MVALSSCDDHMIAEGVYIPEAEGLQSNECLGTNPRCDGRGPYAWLGRSRMIGVLWSLENKG